MMPQRRALLLALACWLGAALVIAAAQAGVTARFDAGLLIALRDWAEGLPPARTEAMRWVSWIGDFPRRLALAALGGAFLARRGEWRPAVALVAAVLLVAALVDYALKPLLLRPRPDLVAWLTHASATSLPSGHAAGAAVTFLSLSALLARHASGEGAAAARIAIGALIAFAIGVSRVWLGVHWPSDVLAGWLIGGGAAALAIGAARR